MTSKYRKAKIRARLLYMMVPSLADAAAYNLSANCPLPLSLRRY